jgi:para-aminobenzoate synthetase component 1
LRTAKTFEISNPILLKKQIISWAQKYREIVFLDSNLDANDYASYNCVLAVDAFTSLKTDYHNAFEDLKQYQQMSKDWLFGYFSYDLKNDIEQLCSKNFDGLAFPDLYFFQPKKIFLFKNNVIEVSYLNICDDEIEGDWNEINEFIIRKEVQKEAVAIRPRISKEDYLKKVAKMINAIKLGSIYEANFCIEYYAENVTVNPIDIFEKLNAISEAPFAVFFKMNKHFLMSASPERYLKKEGETIVSQPIKGTARRHFNPIEDEKIKNELFSNEKERSENIMIVDLVRNDLSRTAQKGSVIVEKLCEPHTFKQVHHLISTVTSKLDTQYTAIDVIKSTFPMGSMTGAPKISAMKIIEELEETKRGLYSGAVGYFKPNGDFDFNVVIRSILYNETNKYISFSVGSAITAAALPEAEYEECLLKANAMLTALQ